MSRIRSFVLLVLVVIVAAASALGIVGGLRTAPDVLASDTAPSVVTVETRQVASDSAVPATLSIRVASWRTAAVALDGVVTSIDVVPGDRLDGGEVVLTVDDQPVVAFVGSAPLVRDIATRARGEDVRRLQEFLLGQDDLETGDLEVDGRYGSATAQLVHEFREEHGMAESPGIGPGDLIWIGGGDFVVRSADISVGVRLSVGDAVLTGQPLSIERAIEAAPLDAQADWLLTIGDVSVPIGSDLSLSDQDALHLWESAGDQEAVPGVIHLAEPISLVELPAAAVWSTDDATCVFAGESHQPLSVDVLEVAFGQARVATKSLAAFPERVVVNPEVLNEPDCQP